MGYYELQRCTLLHFQKLLEIRDTYNMQSLKELKLNIRSEGFDTGRSLATVAVASRNSTPWKPHTIRNQLWNNEKRLFVKVIPQN